MRVFISWSKQLSHDFAALVHDWLPEVIQQVEPWMSSEDIDKGQRWAVQMNGALAELSQGVLCVTAENVREPWLNFEAGALAKSLDGSRVRPLLLDLRPSDVVGPLAQFQSTIATSGDDMLRFARSINDSCPVPLETSRLERAFERTWPEFAKRLGDLLADPRHSDPEPKRKGDDLLAEVLERVRDLQRESARSWDAERPDAISGVLPGERAVVLVDGTVAKVGQAVYHRKLGIGVLRSITLTADSQPRLQVRFKGDGKPRIMFCQFDNVIAVDDDPEPSPLPEDD